jgi:hypothetical protein
MKTLFLVVFTAILILWVVFLFYHPLLALIFSGGILLYMFFHDKRYPNGS